MIENLKKTMPVIFHFAKNHCAIGFDSKKSSLLRNSMNVISKSAALNITSQVPIPCTWLVSKTHGRRNCNQRSLDDGAASGSACGRSGPTDREARAQPPPARVDSNPAPQRGPGRPLEFSGRARNRRTLRDRRKSARSHQTPDRTADSETPSSWLTSHE